MPKHRIHLSIDPDVLERARRYSERPDTSISRLVSNFLAGLPLEKLPETEELTPTVRRLLGVGRQ